VNVQGHWQATGVNVAAVTRRAGGVATLGVP
jgi:hypothetical protein